MRAPHARRALKAGIRRALRAVSAGIVLAAVIASVALAQSATTRVSYLAGGSVYLDAGRRDGLAEGDTLEVVKGGRVVSRLIVRFLSSARAVCDTLQAPRLPEVGDTVRFRARTVESGAAPGATVGGGGAVPGVRDDRTSTGGAASPESLGSVPATTRARHAGRLRGRIGARYLLVDPREGGGYSQPGLELRIDGTDVAGVPVDLGVDVRARRTVHNAAGEADDDEARVYRMAASYHDASGKRRLTVGRQLSSLSTVSLFDGALIEFNGERWGAGLFSGAQPDPSTWAVNGDVLQHGAYVTRRGREGDRRWSIATGGVLSFDQGQTNRQYVFLQGMWIDPRLTLFTIDEIDINTGWKAGNGEPTVSFTSAYLSARSQVTRRVDVYAGYDNRRNVRLYRDRETPETEFDDRHRQGGWLGVGARVAQHVRASVDGRWSGGGTSDDHQSYSGSIEAYRLPALQSDARWRSTRFTGGLSTGWMHVAGLGIRPWGQTRLELSAGMREATDAVSLLRSRAHWEAADVDLGFGPQWYLLLSAQHDHSTGFDAMTWHTSLSRMF